MPVTFKVQERDQPNTGLFSNQFQGTGASQVASVNPINMQFFDSQQAGGVNKMFLDRAGQAYKDEQKQLFENGNLNPGDAKVTGSGDLANRGVGKVLNVVYPDANDNRYGADPANNQQYKDDLKAAYTNMFNEALEHDITKIQMPLGGTGIFGGNIAKEDMAKLQGDAMKSAMADFQKKNPGASLDVNLTTEPEYTQLMQNQDLNNPQQQQVHVQPTQQPKKKPPQQPVIEFAPDIAPANQSLPKTFTFGQGQQATLSKTKEPGKFSLDFDNSRPVQDNMKDLFKSMGINPPPEAKAGPNGELIYTLDASQSQKFNQAIGIGQSQEKGQSQDKHEPENGQAPTYHEGTNLDKQLYSQKSLTQQSTQAREDLANAKDALEKAKEAEKQTKKEAEAKIKELEKTEKQQMKDLKPFQEKEIKTLERKLEVDLEVTKLESAKTSLEKKEAKYTQNRDAAEKAGGVFGGIKKAYFERKLEGVEKEKEKVLGKEKDEHGQPISNNLDIAKARQLETTYNHEQAQNKTRNQVDGIKETRAAITEQHTLIDGAEKATQNAKGNVEKAEQRHEELKGQVKSAEERVKEAEKQQKKDDKQKLKDTKEQHKADRKGVSFPSSSGMGGGNQGKGSSLVGLSGIKVEDTNKVQKDASPTKPKSSEQQIS